MCLILLFRRKNIWAQNWWILISFTSYSNDLFCVSEFCARWLSDPKSKFVILYEFYLNYNIQNVLGNIQFNEKYFMGEKFHVISLEAFIKFMSANLSAGTILHN